MSDLGALHDAAEPGSSETVAQLLRVCSDADAQRDGYTAFDLFADYLGSRGERRSLVKRDKV